MLKRSNIWMIMGCAALAAAACNSESGGGEETESSSTNEGGAPMDDGSGNADGDCLTDGEELALGTDPNSVDSDLDGVSDCDEVACVSDPINGLEQCYACGWQHNDPGDLVPTGAQVGDVIADLSFVDQCGETLSLWDFAKAYHILYLTAGW